MIRGPVSELDREKYRDLWRGVVYRAIEDLYHLSEQPLYADNLAWFDLESDDFMTVCDFGELDPIAVRRISDAWVKTKDKKVIRVMMLALGICSPTAKDVPP